MRLQFDDGPMAWVGSSKIINRESDICDLVRSAGYPNKIYENECVDVVYKGTEYRSVQALFLGSSDGRRIILVGLPCQHDTSSVKSFGIFRYNGQLNHQNV